MQFQYETERLLLQVCNEEYAPALLTFMTDNREFFAPYEPHREPAFYTEAFQAQVLRAEFQAMLRHTYIRYYLFLKEDPARIIGTVSFSNISRTDDKSCRVGYKLDEHHTGKGYATEALTAFLPVMMERLHLAQVEGICDARNTASIRVLEKCGFRHTFAGDALYHGKIQPVVRLTYTR